MGQVRSQPKVAAYPDKRIIQDRIKEAPLYTDLENHWKYCATF